MVQNTEKSLLQCVRDLYVADSVICFNDLTKVTKFYHLTKSILAFNFRKWETNNLVLRDIISLEKTVNDVQNEKADESTYAQSQLDFNSHKSRKLLRMNLDSISQFRICGHNRCCFQVRNYKTEHSSCISYVLRSFRAWFALSFYNTD